MLHGTEQFINVDFTTKVYSLYCTNIVSSLQVPKEEDLVILNFAGSRISMAWLIPSCNITLFSRNRHSDFVGFALNSETNAMSDVRWGSLDRTPARRKA
jgi:hypothetical protein